MSAQNGTFAIGSWDEAHYDESGESKLTRVRATMTYDGVINGAGVVDYLMCSPDGGVTTFVGLERFTGTIGGRSGSAVFQHHGTFANDTAASTWVVVPGSGHDGLRGLRGEGCYPAQNEQSSLRFAFDFENST